VSKQKVRARNRARERDHDAAVCVSETCNTLQHSESVCVRDVCVRGVCQRRRARERETEKVRECVGETARTREREQERERESVCLRRRPMAEGGKE